TTCLYAQWRKLLDAAYNDSHRRTGDVDLFRL
ncbi:MAG: hypothetical protein ACI89U_001040, partial [Gammaproteobacteria bacterium]